MKIWLIMMTPVLAVATMLAGCGRQSEPPAGAIVSRAVNAVSQIKTYKLDSTLTDNYTVQTGDSSHTTQTIWLGKVLLNIPRDAMMSSMNITSGSSTPFVWDDYLIGGWRYHHRISPQVFDSQGLVDPWSKTKLSDQAGVTAASVGYIGSLIDLLKTAPQVNVAATEQVDGVDCYLLEFMPTPEAASDWVLSQGKPEGPGLGWWMTSVSRSKEIYMKAYEDGLVKVWVDRIAYRIVRTDVALDFVVKPGNVTRLDMPGEITGQTNLNDVGFDSITTDFEGQYHFSGYGQELSIVLPPEASS